MSPADALPPYGVRPLLNAAGPYTRFGNTTPAAEVRAAMDRMSQSYVLLADLHEVADRVLAEACRTAAAFVVPGAAAGLTLAVAACIAGDDPDRIVALPDAEATVALLAEHRNIYEHALRVPGARLREVDDPSALADDVAAFFFDATEGLDGLEAAASAAHRHGIPVIVDGSLAVPPRRHLWEPFERGADLVAFSGGKGIGGPPASGWVAGRRDLVRSVALQQIDHDVRAAAAQARGESRASGAHTMGIGRGMKVGKEQIAGLLVAVERYLAADVAAQAARWAREALAIEAAVGGIAGVRAEVIQRDEEGPPFVRIALDAERTSATPGSVYGALVAGHPRICVSAFAGRLSVSPMCLPEGAWEIVAERLAAVLRDSVR
jgi:D-glucosaminate-6-phosphate ammonia-lyase